MAARKVAGRGKAAAGKGRDPKGKKKQKVTKLSAAQLRVETFVREYLLDQNGRRAAIAAGYSAQSARQTASELLATAEVQAKLQAAYAKRAEVTDITAAAVLERLNAIATADPRELIELHRCCCRYCWGKGFRYQRTPRELDELRHAHLELVSEAEALKKPAPVFDEAGGAGYNPKRDPNPDCPECFGDGVERIVAKDTRDLSPAARLLYAGVKTTQHGLEIKMHDQTGMLVNVGKHLGMFVQRVAHGGDPGNPSAVPVGVIMVPAKAGGDDGA